MLMGDLGEDPVAFGVVGRSLDACALSSLVGD